MREVQVEADGAQEGVAQEAADAVVALRSSDSIHIYNSGSKSGTYFKTSKGATPVQMVTPIVTTPIVTKS